MKFKKSNLEPITIEINGEKYPARLTFRALAELEELTKVSFITLFNKLAEGSFETNDIIYVIYVALKYGGVEVTLDDLNDTDFDSAQFKNTLSEISKLLSRTQKVVSSLQDNDKTGESEKK